MTRRTAWWGAHGDVERGFSFSWGGSALAALAVIGVGCAPSDPVYVEWPTQGACEAPMVDDAVATFEHVFEARDFRCANGDPEPCLAVVPLRPEAQRTVAVPTGDTRSYFYVLDAVSLPTPVRGEAVGLSLDDWSSGLGHSMPTVSCIAQHPDYTSAHDPSVRGVDNAYAGFLGLIEGSYDPVDCDGELEGCLDRRLAQDILAGTWLLAVEVRDVESLLHDPDVTVLLHAVSPQDPGGLVTNGGRLASDQAFVSIRVIASVSGDIVHGRLRARLGDVDLPSGGELGRPGEAHDAELRAALCEGALSAGVLGGAMSVDGAVETWVRLTGNAEFRGS